jgi:hypothetical protein
MCVGISPQAHEGTMHRAGAFEPDAIVPVCLPPTVNHYPTTPRLSREIPRPALTALSAVIARSASDAASSLKRDCFAEFTLCCAEGALNDRE